MHNRISQIEALLKHPLPGSSAHKKMSPEGRGNTEEHIQTLLNPARMSAVMVLLFEEEAILKMVLIKRPDYQGVHSGQISFPGGKYEDTDRDFEQTALRETEEEIGITSHQIQMLGALSRIYIPPSNFIVYPFVGFINTQPTFKLETQEVEKLILPPIDILLDESIRKEGSFIAGGNSEWKVKAPYYSIYNEKIWGATAAILSELKEIIANIKAE